MDGRTCSLHLWGILMTAPKSFRRLRDERTKTEAPRTGDRSGADGKALPRMGTGWLFEKICLEE